MKKTSVTQQLRWLCLYFVVVDKTNWRGAFGHSIKSNQQMNSDVAHFIIVGGRNGYASDVPLALRLYPLAT